MSLDMLILSSTVHPAVLLTHAHVRMKCFHFSIAEGGECWERCEQPGVALAWNRFLPFRKPSS